MSTQIIDGKAIAAEIRAEVAERVRRLKEERGVMPAQAFILVGENPASISYVRGKGRACEDAGILSETIHLPESTSETELLELIAKANADPKLHGMLVQLPLPPQIDEQRVTAAIAPEK
ncbi:MAG: tetrahydrofolate dehydrogenase/cyclohydrolase catalytic domain-containing protein, partial [Dehalococcoidia bacterium]